MCDESEIQARLVRPPNYSPPTARDIVARYQAGELYFVGADLRGADLTNAYLACSNLREANLQAANLHGTNLADALLERADLTMVRLDPLEIGFPPDLSRAKLMGATLASARLMSAQMDGADLTDARLPGARLDGAVMTSAILKGSVVSQARFDEAVLFSADFSGTTAFRTSFAGAHMVDADVTGADLELADFTGADIRGVKYDRTGRTGRFRGVGLAGARGNQLLKRFAADHEYLEEYLERHPRLYRIWGVLADHGLGWKRWAAWSLGSVLLFGFLFWALSAHFFIAGTGCDPASTTPQACRDVTAFTHFYYSIVTFTTLGFGDVTPTTWLGEVLVVLEVVLGYVMLGGLVSILATKLARRS